MRKLALVLISSIVMLASCMPNYEPPKKAVEPMVQQDTITEDTIQVVDLSGDERVKDSIIITITDQGVRIRSTTINTDYTAAVQSMNIRLNEYVQPTFISANSSVLLSDKTSSGLKYTYLDNNTIIVQRGNSINGIINDHKRMGYSISYRSLMGCNPYLAKKGRMLQPGDTIKLTCK